MWGHHPIMWIRNTEETEAVHIEGISKETILDAFVYPLRAIRGFWKKNGRICNEINGGNVATTEISAKRSHQIQKTA